MFCKGDLNDSTYIIFLFQSHRYLLPVDPVALTATMDLQQASFAPTITASPEPGLDLRLRR